MAGLNRAEIIGNLGSDPDLRTLDNGTGDMVATFSVATNETWKDKNTGEKKEQTEWHRVVAWRQLARVCGEYLQKGSKVYIAGKLQTRKYTGQDGVERYTTEIVARDMVMLDSKPSSGRPPHPGDVPAPPNTGGGGSVDEAPPSNYDEDLPF